MRFMNSRWCVPANMLFTGGLGVWDFVYVGGILGTALGAFQVAVFGWWLGWAMGLRNADFYRDLAESYRQMAGFR